MRERLKALAIYFSAWSPSWLEGRHIPDAGFGAVLLEVAAIAGRPSLSTVVVAEAADRRLPARESHPETSRP